MKRNIKVLLLILCVVLILSGLSGCSKCEYIEYKFADVTIVDEYYQPVYKAIVNHNGVKYVVYDSKLYKDYKSRVGDIVEATIEIKHYNTGASKTRVVCLG